MQTDCIPFRQTGYFSKLICDYLDEKESLNPFFNRSPNLENFSAQIEEKIETYPLRNRSVLVAALEKQYENFSVSESTQSHLADLSKKDTFTIVTGHQLNLFTGPLYFLYKIISTINLTRQLKQAHPEYNFVPVYWMATEDHDFEEINYFNFKGKKIQWNLDASGAVGRLHTKGLERVYEVIAEQFGETDNAKSLKTLFERAYLQHDNLAAATRYLANELFGEYGLVIVDGDDKALKELLVPYMKQDIFGRLPYSIVSETNDKLSKISESYKIQVNPREINYFYLKDNLRERIVETNGQYQVNDTDMEFSKEELENEMAQYPERFSPNVIARPLYQEVILPNLCYIGGGGELAYWLQLKDYFGALGVTFPMLLLRNSALVATEKQIKKLDGMQLSIADLFLKQTSLINKQIRKISNIDIDFSPQKKLLEKHFESLYDLAAQTDKSFIGAVKAQEVKQKKGLEVLEKRLLKAQKRKLKDQVARMTAIQNELFPNQSLQERQLNFSELYLEHGALFIVQLQKVLKPLVTEFFILRS